MQRQCKQIEINYQLKPNRSITLTNSPLMRFWLRNKYVQPALQMLSVGLFIMAIYATFVGPQDKEINFGSLVFWGLWWSPFMIVSLLLLGRVWCYICPIGAINTFLQRFSRNHRFPTFLNKRKILGLSFSVLSITAITFIFARLPLYKLGVVSSPVKTGIYFLLFLGLAVCVTLLFERRVFCRYICPVTGVMSVTSKLTPIEFVHEKAVGVRHCVTAEFQSSYLSTDHRCVYCMACTTEKPDATVKMKFRWPGAAAVKEKFPLADEALIALIIFAVFPIDHVLGKLVANIPAIKELPLFFAKSIPYLTSIMATILAFSFVNLAATRWSGFDTKTSFTRFAFAYIPLGIMFQLGAVMQSLMSEGGRLLNGFATGVGITLNLPEAWASPETIDAWSNFRYTGLLWLAASWGAIIAWKIAKDMSNVKDMRQVLRAFLPHLLFMAICTYIVMITMLNMHH